MTTYEPGAPLPELRVTPDRYLTYRYAGASGDYNPIHLDEAFAHQVGLPGRILHGLWTMAQVARAVTEAASDPAALQSLTVEFRAMGVPEAEVVVASAVADVLDDGTVVVSCEASQGDAALVRNGRAVLRP